MKTSELQGVALDWAVALCEVGAEFICEIDDPHFYSTDWAQGGPIIEREKIDALFYVDHLPDDADVASWFASCGGHRCMGDTLLVAAMRAYVTCKLGDEVEIPEEMK